MDNDGGPAFPNLAQPGNKFVEFVTTGMSLRDYFAAHAPKPPWWCAQDNQFVANDAGLFEYAEAVARWNRIFADAMLEALTE